MHFEVIGKIEAVETIAVGGNIRISWGFEGNLALPGGASWKELQIFAFKAAESAKQKFTGMKRMGSEPKRW